MITELLDSAIVETNLSNFEITEFQLGQEPMTMFINECQNDMGNFKASIFEITLYKGVSISKHKSTDAILYSIQPKNKK